MSKRNLCLLASLGASLGMVLGFAVPLAAAHRSNRYFATSDTVIIDAAASDKSVNAELERLQTRNRRLEVLVAALRQRAASK